jgi:hypothetical protein
MHYEDGHYCVDLVDDGTLDTVVVVTDKETGVSEEQRFDCETAADYRDPDTGGFTQRGFNAFVDECVFSD